MTDYLTGAGLLLGAVGCGYAVLLIVQQRGAETEVSKKIGADPDFRKLMASLKEGNTASLNDVAEALGVQALQEDGRRRAMEQLLTLVQSKTKALEQEKRKLVAAGLEQSSELGRREYLDKLLFLAAHQTATQSDAAVGSALR